MLHVRESGQGQPVLLLHAFPLSSRMWLPQLGGLGPSARLIAPDFPGFGLSPAPGWPPRIDDYAAAVMELLDHARLENVIVCGLSMGGYVAFRLIEKLGARLRGLVLADTRATADTPDGALARHELAAEIEAQGLEVAVDEFLPKLLGPTTMRANRSLIDRVRAIILENSIEGVCGALRAMAARPDSTDLLPRVACPVLCIAGDEDMLTPPDVARQMASLAPKGRAEVIENAGHLTNLESPESFDALLAAFITECAPPKRARKPRRTAAGKARPRKATSARKPAPRRTGAARPKPAKKRSGAKPRKRRESKPEG